MTLLAAAEAATSVGSPILNIAIFGAFVVGTLVIVIRVASGKKTAGEFYTGGAAFSGGGVLFGDVRDWTVPPRFDGWDTAPEGLVLPT